MANTEAPSSSPVPAAPRKKKTGLAKAVASLREEIGLDAIPFNIRLAQALAAPLPYLAFGRLRTAIYRLCGVRIGKGSSIDGSIRLWGAAPLSIGAKCWINGYCRINTDAPVTIGNNVGIGMDVLIITGTHEIGTRFGRVGARVSHPVTIEDGVWVGANATILPGVTLGRGCVVAAGAVVTKDVAPNTVVGGSPAREIRALDELVIPTVGGARA